MYCTLVLLRLSLISHSTVAQVPSVDMVVPGDVFAAGSIVNQDVVGLLSKVAGLLGLEVGFMPPGVRGKKDSYTFMYTNGFRSSVEISDSSEEEEEDEDDSGDDSYESDSDGDPGAGALEDASSSEDSDEDSDDNRVVDDGVGVGVYSFRAHGAPVHRSLPKYPSTIDFFSRTKNPALAPAHLPHPPAARSGARRV